MPPPRDIDYQKQNKSKTRQDQPSFEFYWSGFPEIHKTLEGTTVSPNGPPEIEGKFLTLSIQLILNIGHREAYINLKMTSLDKKARRCQTSF